MRQIGMRLLLLGLGLVLLGGPAFAAGSLQLGDEAAYGSLKQELSNLTEGGAIEGIRADAFLERVIDLSTETAAIRADDPNGVELKIQAAAEELELNSQQIGHLVQLAATWVVSVESERAVVVDQSRGRVSRSRGTEEVR